MSSNLKPFVNGISPKEGTPGTKLTIRGDNLGVSSGDILRILVGKIDVGCSVTWNSSKKLNIITPLGEGDLKIIVVTKSGGEGTCDVEYFQSIPQSVGLQEPVSFWPPNEQKQHQVLMSYSKRTQPKYLQSEMIEDIQDVMLGHHNLPTNFALPDDELVKFYKGRGSTTLTEQDFNPILFLLKYHYKTNYYDLLKTLDNYKKVMANDKMKEPISIVKANLYTIFQCLECLETLKKKIDDEKSTTREMSGAFSEKNLLSKLEESKNIAHHMYEEVLKRRDYADSVRSALSVMQRFGFLFNLPHSIRENISKGEYSLVINDYLRARSTFGSSEIRLFQQVYKDVVEVIDKFKEMLKRQLLEMPKKCDAVKVTIRFLRQLEIDYDPTWVCLENQRDWILQTIRKLNVSAFTCQTRIDKPVGNNSAKNSTVQLIDELNKLLSETFNETWNVACYYLEEQSSISSFSKKQSIPQQEMQPRNRKIAVEKIVYAIATSYATKMRESLSQNNLTSGWLVYCLQHVRLAYDNIQMDQLPNDSCSILIGLLDELRVKCVRAVLSHAEQDIANLAYKENWNSEISDQLGAVTRLPILYRNIMLSSFSEIGRIIHSCHKMECCQTITSSHDNVTNNDVSMQQLPDWITFAMCAFITCIDTILDKLMISSPIPQTNDGHQSHGITSSQSLTNVQQAPPDNGVINANQITNISNLSTLTVSRLLLMANNCHYCITTINESIINQIRHEKLLLVDNIDVDNTNVNMIVNTNVNTSGQVLANVQNQFQSLHNRLVNTYINVRIDLLIYHHITTLMNINNIDNWQNVPIPKHARTYIHTILATLSNAHSELELISPHLSRPSIVTMIVRVIEAINRSVEQTDRQKWSRRGHMQLAVDLGVLEMILQSLSPHKCSSFTSDMAKEAMSLMNIMRGAFRLLNDEQTTIKRALQRENISIALLIKGFRGIGDN